MPARRRVTARGRAWARVGSLVALALLAGGCAALGRAMGGYHDAARGVGEGGDLWLRPALERGRYEAALARLTSGPGAPSDALLRALHTGAVAHYAGRFDASARALGAAAALAEDRYTKSLGRNGLAMLTSDLVLPYAPGRTERLLVHYYGLVGYLKQDSAAAAAVEARRLSRLLAQYGEDRAPAERATHALMHYLAGVAFEAAGERTDADVAYRNAAAVAADSALADGGRAARPTATRRRRRPTPPPTEGTVVVVFEQGFVGRRAESGGTVRFDSSEVARLAEGDADTSVLAIVRRRVAAARSDEPETTAAADGPGDGGAAGVGASDPPAPSDATPATPVRPPVFAGSARREPAYPLRIAWPTFVRDPGRRTVGAVVAGAPGAAPVGLRVTADLSDAVARDLERQRAALVARAAGRAAVKYWATRTARRKGGRVGGPMVSAATSLLERADTRSWHLLPGTIGAARLSLPAGTHEIAVELPADAPGLAPVRVPLGTVTVRAGRVTLLSTRVFDGAATTVAGTARGVI